MGVRSFATLVPKKIRCHDFSRTTSLNEMTASKVYFYVPSEKLVSEVPVNIARLLGLDK